MRTTINIKSEHYARLLKLASRRGQRGISSIIEEAIDLFLDTVDERDRDLQQALTVRGSLSAKEAEGMRDRVSQLRQSW